MGFATPGRGGPGIPFSRIYARTFGGHGVRPGASAPRRVRPPAFSTATRERRHRHCSSPWMVGGGWSEMKVAVENITGRFLYVEVEQEAEEDGGGATVGRLKTGIASEEAVLEQRMILVTQGGRVMADDGAALSQYGVREGSLVYLYFFPDGTTKWPRSAYDYLCVDNGDDGDGAGAGAAAC